ncbi:hypothetical protein CN918_25740 [Priestia megaterium]|nr:hypothetical protein CN918_25740 [Priestia megaterium]
MKKRYLWLILCILMMSQLIVSPTLAADKKQSFVLLSETFDDFGIQGQIYRHYQNVDTKEDIYYNIYIPADIYKKVKDTENPLLEAKKELTVAYRHLKLEKRLKELNGVYLNDYPNAEIVIGDALTQTFNDALDKANVYADSETAKIEKLSKAEQDKLFVSDRFDYVDYGKEAAIIDKEYPENKEIAKLVAKDKDDVNVSEPDTSKSTIPIGTYVLIMFVLLLIVGVTITIFKKRG